MSIGYETRAERAARFEGEQESLARELITPAQMAELVDKAATRIHNHGLASGDYWTDSVAEDFDVCEPVACCTVAALAIEAGFTSAWAIDRDFLGLTHGTMHNPHPLLPVVVEALGFVDVETLFAWSDMVQDRVVVAALRDVATLLRERGDV